MKISAVRKTAFFLLITICTAFAWTPKVKPGIDVLRDHNFDVLQENASD